MPYVNGIYQPSDTRSPLDRLYGFQQRMAEMDALKQKQAMMAQRQQIMKESFTPEQAAEVQTPEDVDAALSRMFGPQAQPGMTPADLPSTEAKPASFDVGSAISRLYGANDLEGAQALINDQYKSTVGGRAAGAEKWAKTGVRVRGEDGKMYNQVQSDAGNTKLVPIDGELVGQGQVINSGDANYVIDPYTNEVRATFRKGMTPDQMASNNPELQARIAAAKAGAQITAEGRAKEVLGAESAAATSGKTISIIDELINHPGRDFATGKSGIFNVVPGTEGADFVQKLEQLSGQTFLSEIGRLKGLGALSDAEGKKLSAAAAALSTKRTDAGFLNELKKLRSELEFFQQKAERMKAQRPAAQAASTATGPAPAASQAPMPSLPNPAQHNGRIARDQKTGIRYKSNGSQWMRIK